MNFFQAEKLRLAHLGLEITAALPEGQFVALLGPNGIGKTTLLRTLIGEEKIREGELRLFERPIFEISPQELSTTVAYVPQDHEYPMHLRVVDLLRYAFLPSTGWFRPLPPEDDPRILRIAEGFELSGLCGRALGNLSTGERQRAFLARACLQTPKCLLLDEPTNHLDPGGVKRFWTLLREAHAQAHFSVLMSTHELSMVREYCDWVLAIGSAGVVYCGKAAEFFQSPLSETLYSKG
ncbi:MAG: ABC transporter ATP-binding protein [Bdellovibrionaceae bacterium]|nr:ABC transporter ATP-binding protein [Bdellovibrionales bacterium]MCB9253106.1 ABC transporter ATP-binding protein [Pseudobdellovibrionaceae bacterium]